MIKNSFQSKRQDAPTLVGTKNITVAHGDNRTYVDFTDLVILSPPAGRYYLDFSAFNNLKNGSQLIDELLNFTGISLFVPPATINCYYS